MFTGEGSGIKRGDSGSDISVASPTGGRRSEAIKKAQEVEASLTPQQKEQIANIKAQIEPHPANVERRLTNFDVWRFITTNGWDDNKTLNHLTEYLDWWQNARPDLIKPITIRSELIQHKAFLGAHNNLGRPILSVIARNHLPENTTQDMVLKFAAFLAESTMNEIIETPGVSSYDLVISLKGFGYHNLDIGSAKEGAHVLQRYFPGDMLGRIFCVNNPFFLSVMFNSVKPFLLEKIKRKINFLKHTEDLYDVEEEDPKNPGRMVKIFSPEMFIPEFGGTATYALPDNDIFVHEAFPWRAQLNA
eukprot:TRINITY_DN386_c2_g1_i1.p1 TRINITY_DN386_c2_g1~~TRINITY_DN386_c2_g1_i1.p1  ORF type:complete len:304 (-),score=85.07 TRINITY_DN386_c2_g1_i1:139-1050(-)